MTSARELTTQRYVANACTLEVTASPSALSQWSQQPLLKQARFKLWLQEGPDQRLLAEGNQAQLAELIDGVQTYLHQHLHQHLNPFSGDRPLQSLTDHRLPLAHRSAPLALKALELFDVAEALDQYGQTAAVLPPLSVSRRSLSTANRRRRPRLLWTGSVAAAFVVAISVTATLRQQPTVLETTLGDVGLENELKTGVNPGSGAGLPNDDIQSVPDAAAGPPQVDEAVTGQAQTAVAQPDEAQSGEAQSDEAQSDEAQINEAAAAPTASASRDVAPAASASRDVAPAPPAETRSTAAPSPSTPPQPTPPGSLRSSSPSPSSSPPPGQDTAAQPAPSRPPSAPVRRSSPEPSTEIQPPGPERGRDLADSPPDAPTVRQGASRENESSGVSDFSLNRAPVPETAHGDEADSSIPADVVPTEDAYLRVTRYFLERFAAEALTTPLRYRVTVDVAGQLLNVVPLNLAAEQYLVVLPTQPPVTNEGEDANASEDASASTVLQVTVYPSGTVEVTPLLD